MMSRKKKIVLWVLAIVVGLPTALIVIVLAWISISDKTNGTIVSSGETRRYLLYVPKTYDPSRPTPLIISLHPAAGWPAAERNITGWNELADQHGFIVVYPAGTGFPQIWRAGQRSLGSDVKFISDLMDKLEADLVPYKGGKSPDPFNPITFPDVRAWTASWAQRNRCPGDPIEARVTASVRRLTYTSCAGNADVVLYTIEGGGHTWPGGEDLPEWFVGRTTHEISATRLMWEFYLEHPRAAH